MSAYISNLPPIILTGSRQGLPWFQKGYTYGKNDSGPYQTWIEEGRDADIDTNAAIFEAQGWTIEVVRLTHKLSRLTAHAGWKGGATYAGEVLENNLELEPEHTDKGILEADFPFGSVNLNTTGAVGSQKTREALAKMANDENVIWVPPAADPGKATLSTGLAFKFDDGSGGADTATYIGLPSSDYGSAFSLYKLMKAGVSQFPMDAPTIRRSYLVSNLYSTLASYSNVRRIISTGSMASIEGVSGSALFSVPTQPTPGQFIETSGDLQYGWMKLRPAVTKLAQFKWRIGQNYQFGLWPVKLYGSVL
jgi:hypothetical protein